MAEAADPLAFSSALAVTEIKSRDERDEAEEKP